MNEAPKPTLIDLDTIAESYGYKPIPDGFEEPEQVDTVFQWSCGKDERSAEIQRNTQIILNELKANPLCLLHNPRILLNSKITTDSGEYSLQSYLRMNPNTKELILFVELYDSQHQNIGGCTIKQCTAHEWDINHRYTDESYRRKGIMSELIRTLEAVIQEFADSLRVTQKIIMEASQLPVLNTFIKNGYSTVQAEPFFSETMQRLEAGDSRYKIMSCREDFVTDYPEKKTWYVFRKVRLRKFGRKIWHFSRSSNEFNYIKHSVRFVMTKYLEPRAQDFRNEITATRDAIEETLPDETTPEFI